MDYDEGVAELGLVLPDYTSTPYYGPSYGSMKSHHRVDCFEIWLTVEAEEGTA
jgi:hypothetical protein